jgi:N-methylhydantoinase A
VKAEPLYDIKATLGEGPVWDAGTQTLYWIDILNKRIYANKNIFLEADETIGCLSLRKDGGLIFTKRASIWTCESEVLDRKLATAAVQKVADALGLSLQQAALGIYNIVNENMTGALRLVSVEQGYDPRDYALIAFGGAGPLHANALARLLGSWPAIIPPGPGVLCALGDSTTAVRDERSRTFVRTFKSISAGEVAQILRQLAADASDGLKQENVPAADMQTSYQVEVRYRGQGLRLSVDVRLDELEERGLLAISEKFDAEHKRLFTFTLSLEHELVTLRAAVRGKSIQIERPAVKRGGRDPKAAEVGAQAVFMDGKGLTARVYDRVKLEAGNVMPGPAIIMEMDSTTVVLPEHRGHVDAHGNILIYPASHPAVK